MATRIFVRGGIIAIVMGVCVLLWGVLSVTTGESAEKVVGVNEIFLGTAEMIMTSFSPTAEAAVRSDHGLPMTNVPYRYSMYFFLLAIVLSNFYLRARAERGL